MTIGNEEVEISPEQMRAMAKEAAEAKKDDEEAKSDEAESKKVDDAMNQGRLSLRMLRKMNSRRKNCCRRKNN